MKRRITALLTICMIIAAADCALAQEETSIADPMLVKTVTEYAVDYETKDWYEARVYEYTYEDGYPVEVTCTDHDAGINFSVKYEYTFEDGVPATRKDFNDNGEQTQLMEYNEGRPYQRTLMDSSGSSDGYYYYSYANGDEYLTLLLSEGHDYKEDGQLDDTMEEVDSIDITTQDGLLKKSINTGMYANWSEGDRKEWLRFNGTYTANYDDNGILTDTSAVYRAGPSGPEYKMEKTIENGLVTELVRQTPDREPDTWVNEAKFTFEYTDTPITAARYAKMINSYALGETNMYYVYTWY